MTKKVKCHDFEMLEELILPKKILKCEAVCDAEQLTVDKAPCVSFNSKGCAFFSKKGAWVLIDFGKEICGSARIIAKDISYLETSFRFTFGESVSEACSEIGLKNATNNHSPRDFSALVSCNSDINYGNTGFRFLRLELLEDRPTRIQSIFAVNRLPYIEDEAVIKTSDEELNSIIDTATYTLKLNMQNGYFWDGIKRDRLIWSGDLHGEVLTSLYLFGDTKNVRSSIEFLKSTTDSSCWMNGIPSYSAWWIINLCDYCTICGNNKFFEENSDYAEEIFEHINNCITDDAEIVMEDNIEMKYFLDWGTYESDDAYIGTAMLFILAAQKYLKLHDNSNCHSIISKLDKYIYAETVSKQARAFQILAGRKSDGDDAFLEKDGASGFSTFMAYYILSAYVIADGKKSFQLIKQYYGGMLSKGATSFWEDFDIKWLENTCGIDEFPTDGQLDIHGDFGNYCYTGFRHSLCHGWSCSVVLFIIESIFGIRFENGCRRVYIKSNDVEFNYNINLPTPYGDLFIKKTECGIEINAPHEIEIIG